MKEKIENITNLYIQLIEKINEVFRYQENLSKIDSYLDELKHDLENNPLAIISHLTSNYLAYLEPIKEKNYDFFTCQKKYSKKRDGKIIKNKVTYIIGKIMLKEVLVENNVDINNLIFDQLVEMFKILLNENGDEFENSYIKFVKENYNTSRNYNKMLIVMDNVEDILCDDITEEIDQDDTEDDIEGDNEDADKETQNEENKSDKSDKSDKSNKKSKSKGKKRGGIDEGFFKNLENSSIAKLAKNISEKIKPEDFPELNDPSKLLSGLTNPSALGEEGGIGNLLKFVVTEVESAIKSDNMKENDLVNEAQNLMGNINPADLMSGNGLGDLFSQLLNSGGGGGSGSKKK
jgi:hypothetical protein